MAGASDVSALVRALRGSSRAVHLSAAQRLYHVMQVDHDARQAFVAAGGLPLLVKLLQSSTHAVQKAAAVALAVVAADSFS